MYACLNKILQNTITNLYLTKIVFLSEYDLIYNYKTNDKNVIKISRHFGETFENLNTEFIIYIRIKSIRLISQ